MDDLDHSIHIAEYDWTSFYEDSEECSLLQPSLAYPDNSSDSEDSSSVFEQEPQHRPAANKDAPEGNTRGCSTVEESCTGCIEVSVQLNQSDAGRQRDDVTTKAEEDIVTQVDSEICLDGGNTAEHITDVTNNITDTLHTEVIDVQVSVQTESDICDFKSIHEPDPDVKDQNVNEPLAAEKAVAVSEDVGSAPIKAEKERWFVTVNESPARHRPRIASVKKKRRQKKPCKDNHMTITLGYGFESEVNRDKKESEREMDMKFIMQLHQNSGGHLKAEINPESLQWENMSSLTSSEEDNVSHSSKENTDKPTMDRNKYEICSLANTFTLKDLSQLESMESDEFEDSVEFFSSHSYDSESYVSASESVEDPLHLIKEQHTKTQQMQCNAVITQDREMHSCNGALSSNAAATNCEGYEIDRAYVEPTVTFPSASQRVDKMPDDNSTCDIDTDSTAPHMHSDAPGLQKDELPTEVNLPASGCTMGDQLGSPPLPVPDLTVTPCSVVDSPETYAEATGHTRPVYAISAFWDEMEKLTINDILQLRMGRSTPHRETQETVRPNVDTQTHSSSLADTEEYHLSDVGLLDISDTADSDYCTLSDESKPDRSSCDFSTSDFEEDYWQFISASRNPSPDSYSKTQHSQRTPDFLFSAHDEDGSTSSEGKETPVPLEHSDQELQSPRQMLKSESVQNIQALNTEELSLQGLFSNDDSSLFLGSCKSLEESAILDLSDSLETLVSAPILSNTDVLDEHYRITFPEVFEYFFMQGKAENESSCVTVYDPENLSVAPTYEHSICLFRDEMSFSSLHDSRCGEGKPIPIFSCSHPTVRELTFPKPDYFFLSADTLEEDDISPIRVVSHSLIQTSDCGIVRSQDWKSLLSIRKISFHGKGSIWCRGSGTWVFPAAAEKRADPQIPVLDVGRVSSAPSKLFGELAVQQSILDAAKQESTFSTLKQSDMCLVCIAFASWVLTSSDPKAADAWKAALLANVSALSAIRYLRQYVKKRSSLHDDP
ncbi:uncharacterized protein LOC128355275 [Scomber scombrus]|uniref:Uncharacterized protein LOC128355275 n=1 Tax=Scomber scombrus TaxID=13677 RepID=A0AAV1PPE7_SCOSC